MSLFWMPCKNVSASFKGCHSARFRKRFPPYCSVIGPLVEDFPSTVPLLQRRSPITCCEPPSGARERRTNGWLGEITPGDSSSAGGGENPEKELSDSEMFLQLLERFGLGGGGCPSGAEKMPCPAMVMDISTLLPKEGRCIADQMEVGNLAGGPV